MSLVKASHRLQPTSRRLECLSLGVGAFAEPVLPFRPRAEEPAENLTAYVSQGLRVTNVPLKTGELLVGGQWSQRFVCLKLEHKDWNLWFIYSVSLSVTCPVYSCIPLGLAETLVFTSACRL